MKIKLKQPIKADNGEVTDELVTCSDYATTKIVLAGRKHSDPVLAQAEQIRVWCQLTQPEFDQLALLDYNAIVEKFDGIFPREAAEDGPKAATESAETSPPKSRRAS